ncbi:hypothetical protein FHW58_000134 [Duganella sp. 1224]|uniref:hypothetical protein n=1 Tax=Duganella sp. 1224 TaxID=2587052 RepID=UPI0015CC4DF3|nr:hypothetical protein [Duganella sp. 1224]NYE58982.1 hypothetical protein [Duganella sp. 1224]
MKRLFPKLLLAALLAAQHLIASAGTPLTIDIPFNVTYDPTMPGGNGLFVDKKTFEIFAPVNYALTGKMNATLTALYDLGDGVQGKANMDITFDVLLPHCAQCGPNDADLVGTSRNGTFTDNGSGMQYVADGSSASGSYNRLLVYEIVVGSLPAFSGHIYFQTLTFTAETMASPVPELPPVALYGFGLAAMVVAARAKSSKGRTGRPV